MIESKEEIVDRYFSVYLDYPVSQVDLGQIIPVSSKRRLKEEIGWGCTVAIWVHIFRERAVISIRPDLFEALKKMLTEISSPSQLYTIEWRKKVGSFISSGEIGRLGHVLYYNLEHCRLFKAPGCRRLEDSDVNAFVRMKLNLYPECDPDCLATDIRRNIKDGIVFGVFQEGKLVSVSEAPVIGHMQEPIEEVGIETLPEYQRRGYGKAVLSATTNAILNIGRIPIYRCSSKNEASIRLARTVGYEKYADIIEFQQPE